MTQTFVADHTRPSADAATLSTASLVLALCLGQAIGSAAETVQPIWVAAILKSGALTTAQVGWLASAELFFVATGALAVSLLASRAPSRPLMLVAALIVAMSNTIALGSGTAPLVIGRLLSGIGSGMLLALVLRIAVRRQKAQRLLAGMQLTVIFLAIVLFLTSPSLIARFGPRALFAVLALIGVSTLIAAAFGVRHASGPPSTISSSSRTYLFVPILICVGISLVNCAFTTVWTFIVTIGIDLGFSDSSVSHAVALAQPAGLIAPAVATVLGERWGVLRPILGSLGGVAAAAFLLLSASSSLVFGALVAAVLFGATFYVPYVLTSLGRVDSSGSFVSAAPVTFLSGAAVGPTLGAHLLSYSFHSVAMVSALLFLAAIPVFVTADFLATRGRNA
jgi:predicted MFS family arabinose efflux permease